MRREGAGGHLHAAARRRAAPSHTRPLIMFRNGLTGYGAPPRREPPRKRRASPQPICGFSQAWAHYGRGYQKVIMNNNETNVFLSGGGRVTRPLGKRRAPPPRRGRGLLADFLVCLNFIYLITI